jgi:hypothetical protein
MKELAQHTYYNVLYAFAPVVDTQTRADMDKITSPRFVSQKPEVSG